MEAYEQNGWSGASLTAFADRLAVPTPDEDMVRMWLMAKIHVENALMAAGRTPAVAA